MRAAWKPKRRMPEASVPVPVRLGLGPVKNLHIICCYFNPGRCPLQEANAIRFVCGIRLPVTIVELLFDGDKPLFSKSIQLHGTKSTHLMWQKEALLQHALEHLPDECDAVAWLDMDIEFDQLGWANRTLAVLSNCVVCQPWSEAWEEHPIRSEMEPMKPSVCSGLVQGDHDFFNLGKYHPGMAWAARRDFLDDVGFYRHNIVGNGDTTMCRGFFDRSTWSDQFLNPEWREHADAWRDRCHAACQGRVGYVPGSIRHLWHGDRVHRHYNERLTWLSKANYHPGLHVVDDGPLLSFTEQCPVSIPSSIKEYFDERKQFSLYERLGDGESCDVEQALRELARQTIEGPGDWLL